jgi:GT2 family glycosyltransferase
MVSIITVNYNNTKVTLELLRSIEKLGMKDIQMVVVDNGSRENPGPLLKAQHPWITFVRSDINLGFAGGNNLGIRKAKGDYFFFINNDTEFKADILPRLVSLIESHPAIGVLCPLLYYFDTPDVMQYAGFTPFNKVTCRNECLTVTAAADDEGLSYTSFPHGAAMMIPKRVVEAVGMMPETYFLYYEEHDWAEMIKKHGFKIAVDTQSMLFHKESQTVGPISELKSYFMSRNRILFMRRNSRSFYLTLFWIYFLLVATPKSLVSYALKNQWGNIKAHLAGIGWNFQSPTYSQKIGYKFNNLRYS